MVKVAYRFCLEALARTTLVRNDLLEGISLNKMGEGRRRVSAKLKGLRVNSRLLR